MDIQVLAYDMGPFVVSEGITDEMIQSELEVKIGAWLKCRQGSNVVGAMVNIAYQSGDKELLLFGVMLTMGIPDWSNLTNGKSDAEIKALSAPIWSIALNFASGMLIEKAKDTKMKSAFLPAIDLDDFAKSISLEKVQ